MDANLAKTLEGINKSLSALTDLQTKTHQKAISGTADAQLMFGPGGLFSNFGLDETVINASMSPVGLDRLLPVMPTQTLYPVYSYITGFDPDDEAEPAGPCDDAPGGVMETCHEIAQFGRYTRSSKEIEYNEIVGVLNGHLTTDLRVMGDILGQGHQLLSSLTSESPEFVQSVIQTQMVIVGVLFQQKLMRQLWAGTPANNNVGGGYKEFPGLDILVGTGKVDAFSNTACEALDSDVKDFSYAPIYGTNPDIVEYMSMMMYYLQNNARGMGLEPVQWVIAMRPQLFFELTAVWPCRYLTYRCSDRLGADVTIANDDTNVRMRDDMRNGHYLIINGLKVPVALDDGIVEQTPCR